MIDAWLDPDYRPLFDVEVQGIGEMLVRAIARVARKHPGARVRRRVRHV